MNKLGPLDKFWLQDAVDESSHTPDIHKIELCPWKLLFVYDEYQEGHWFHDLIKDHVHPDTRTHVSCFTRERFTVFKKEMKSYTYPVPLERKFPGLPMCRIRGKVYPIKPNRLKQLDIIKQNGVQFDRRRVKLTYPVRRMVVDETGGKGSHFMETDSLRAFMYVAREDHYYPRLTSETETFSPVGFYESKFLAEDAKSYPENVQYYQFTTQEYPE